MTRNYTFGDLPTNYPFQYHGITITKLLDGSLRIEAKVSDINVLPFLYLSEQTDTGYERDIYKLDPTKVLASIGRVYLVKHPDSTFTIEEYDQSGTVHYAQFFTTGEAAMRQFTKQTLTALAAML